MTTDSDAIVVGTGIGGSAVAALLAARGKRVTVHDCAWLKDHNTEEVA